MLSFVYYFSLFMHRHTRHYSNTGPEDIPGQICGIYRIARPWCLLNIIYPGLEQTLKVGCEANGQDTRKDGRATHDIGWLWERVTEGCQDWMEHHYQEWKGLVTFGSNEIEWPPETVGEFLKEVSKGYEEMGEGKGYMRWRYWLLEPEHDETLPYINDKLLLAVWKGAADALYEGEYDRGGREARYGVPTGGANTWLQDQLQIVWQQSVECGPCGTPTLSDFARMLWARANDKSDWRRQTPKIAPQAKNWENFFGNVGKVQDQREEVSADPQEAYIEEWKHWLHQVRRSRLETYRTERGCSCARRSLVKGEGM